MARLRIFDRTDETSKRITGIVGVALAFLIPILPIPWQVYSFASRSFRSPLLAWGVVRLVLEGVVIVLMPLLFRFVQEQDVRKIIRAKDGELPGDIAIGTAGFLAVMLVTVSNWHLARSESIPSKVNVLASPAAL